MVANQRQYAADHLALVPVAGFHHIVGHGELVRKPIPAERIDHLSPGGFALLSLAVFFAVEAGADIQKDDLRGLPLHDALQP